MSMEEAGSVAALFDEAAIVHADQPFVAFRTEPDRPYAEISYLAFAKKVAAARARYLAAGYGIGHRAALLAGNHPDFYMHYLALNGLSVSIVPLNPDARPSEMRYLIDHSEAAFVVVSERYRDLLHRALADPVSSLPVVDAATLGGLGDAAWPAERQDAGIADEAAILYTSGTTGRPKGCILTNRYFLEAGRHYAGWGGRVALGDGCERLLNPLPLFHMNNLVLTTTAMIFKGGCNAMVERFSPGRWWADCRDSGATIVHYLGVMPALLLARPEEPAERNNFIRAGIGAGVDPIHHAAFEKRFGFPLLELWGMSEVGRCLIDNVEPRRVGTRAFGRPDGTIRARVVGDGMQDVAVGDVGELLVQSDDADPRRAFFSGYLKNEEATEAAWHEDWFRTGDLVRQDETGMLFFVDRKKNIVRRSGENIAAAEVEACLQAHPAVVQAAVIAVPDRLREEEVFACVVAKDGRAVDERFARELFDWCMERMTYFKAPGYFSFRDELPTTGTQKIQKGTIFAAGDDPTRLADTFDLRELKRRKPQPCGT